MAAFCLLLPLLWLGHVVFTNRVLLPVPLLQQIAPWGTPRPDGSWNPLMWDAMAFFYPIRHAAAEVIRSGHLPLWNPYILAGTPLLADVQSAIFYPLNVLFWVMPVHQAFGISAYVHLVLALFFTAYWLRAEGVSPSGSLLGAVAFAVGGWSIAWLELPNFMATAVWLPLLLGILAGAARRHWAQTAMGCALLIGVMLTAGHLQIAFYCLFGALLYALFHAAAERRPIYVVPLLLGGALGAMLAAPQILPARALSEASHRSTVATAEGYAGFVRGGQHPERLAAYRASHLTGIVAPDLYGNPSNGPYYGLGEYSEVTSYVGILPLLLGIHGLFLLRRRRAVGALALMAAAGLLLALGTPFNAPLYFGVPGFARFGTPGRALVLFVVAWSGLAAFGWDRLRENLLYASLRQPEETHSESGVQPPLSEERTARERYIEGVQTLASRLQLPEEWLHTVIAGGLFLLLALLAGLLLFPAPLFELLAATGAATLARTTALFLVAALLPWIGFRYRAWLAPAALTFVLLDLWTFGFGYNMTGPAEALRPPERFVEAVSDTAGEGRILAVNPSWPLRQPPRAVLPPNLPMLLWMHDIGGYEGAYLLRYKQMLNEWAGKDQSPPTNGNMVMPTVLTSQMIRELGVRAVLSPGLLPPEVKSRAGLGYVTGEEGWHLYRVLRPTARAEFIPDWPPRPGAAGSPLPVVYRPNPSRIFIRHTKERPGYILLRETEAPGWAAMVDGVPVTPVPTDSPVERVVRVTERDHTLIWEYRPPALAAAWPVALWGALGVLILRLLGFFPRLSPSTRPALPDPQEEAESGETVEGAVEEEGVEEEQKADTPEAAAE